VVGELFAASKVVIVAGKGGVGKTTVGATLAIAAARQGTDVLLVELEGHSCLGAPFGVPALGYEPVPLPAPGATGSLRGRRLTPDEALVDYLEGHGLGRLTRRLVRTGALDVVTSAAPGIRDLLTLGKVRQLEQHDPAGLVVVDAPAAGHAVSFLRAPKGMAGSATVGPVRDQALEALALLSDPARCQVVLVTLPEETPVTEAIETAFSLEDEVGVALGPVVVNAVWPALAGLDGDPEMLAATAGATLAPGELAGLRRAAAYRARRVAAQDQQLARLAAELPLPRLVLPQVFSDRLGLEDLGLLAEVLAAQVAGSEG
jgi:anion-transporting  ArsA/GET3 family ATPase